MNRCTDERKLSELDPVTFFIVTEMMAADRESASRKPTARAEDIESFVSKVA